MLDNAFTGRKHSLLNVGINIFLTDHCNLNCKGCVAFSPLARKNFLDIQKYERDIKRLAELCNHSPAGNPRAFVLVGGEPLLHPDLDEFVKVTRKYFKHSIINIITNGILLVDKKDDFYMFLSDYGVHLTVSRYPIKIDYQKIYQNAIKYGVTFNEEPSGEEWLDFKFNPNQMSKIATIRNFMSCYQNNTNCHALHDGKYYPCNEAARWHIFEEKTDSMFPSMELLGIDIHKAKNLDEILDFISRPISLCSYCGANSLKNSNWGASSCQAKEWIG